MTTVILGYPTWIKMYDRLTPDIYSAPLSLMRLLERLRERSLLFWTVAVPSIRPSDSHPLSVIRLCRNDRFWTLKKNDRVLICKDRNKQTSLLTNSVLCYYINSCISTRGTIWLLWQGICSHYWITANLSTAYMPYPMSSAIYYSLSM